MLLSQDLRKGGVREGFRVITISFKTTKANTLTADNFAVSFTDLCQMSSEWKKCSRTSQFWSEKITETILLVYHTSNYQTFFDNKIIQFWYIHLCINHKFFKLSDLLSSSLTIFIITLKHLSPINLHSKCQSCAPEFAYIPSSS